MTDYTDTPCERCDTPVHPLAIFPGGLCVTCHERETPMPTAAELARMWGGK